MNEMLDCLLSIPVSTTNMPNDLQDMCGAWPPVSMLGTRIYPSPNIGFVQAETCGGDSEKVASSFSSRPHAYCLQM
jgi:hypothetical protein